MFIAYMIYKNCDPCVSSSPSTDYGIHDSSVLKKQPSTYPSFICTYQCSVAVMLVSQTHVRQRCLCQKSYRHMSQLSHLASMLPLLPILQFPPEVIPCRSLVRSRASDTPRNLLEVAPDEVKCLRSGGSHCQIAVQRPEKVCKKKQCVG